MANKTVIIVSLILAIAVGLAGCVTVNPSASEPPETSPPSTPQYHTLTFTIPANSDYSSPIYLRNNETLHLMWTVEGGQDKVWFHIITPSMKSFGFYENGDFANGTLQEGFCQGFEAGMTQFSPSDYDWGEGYYTMLVTNNLAGPLIVKVEYWIES